MPSRPIRPWHFRAVCTQFDVCIPFSSVNLHSRLFRIPDHPTTDYSPSLVRPNPPPQHSYIVIVATHNPHPTPALAKFECHLSHFLPRWIPESCSFPTPPLWSWSSVPYQFICKFFTVQSHVLIDSSSNSIEFVQSPVVFQILPWYK